ncbi:protein of unknown function [Nitrosotalea devaniterrae]|uniref:Uncharacterized protein n=1 Tax=Nitrosotalea devaniterrae TaxID=1078905 RepID=A0A128A3Z4_9ARCH|nr:protein of unknown function [Candidatus Nitrosotalea devanaterra]
MIMAEKPNTTAHHPAMVDWYVRIKRNDAAEMPNVTKDITNIELIFNFHSFDLTARFSNFYWKKDLMTLVNNLSHLGCYTIDHQNSNRMMLVWQSFD